MFTRDGIKIIPKNHKEKNKTTAGEILNILNNGFYVAPSGKQVNIALETKFAIEHTKFYEPNVILNNLFIERK